MVLPKQHLRPEHRANNSWLPGTPRSHRQSMEYSARRNGRERFPFLWREAGVLQLPRVLFRISAYLTCAPPTVRSIRASEFTRYTTTAIFTSALTSLTTSSF